ncbi:rhotekin-2-like [Scyliorhinus canicula]|uniref:rhotekin-2-like n=1 Tax=Scyliorhinus canicula TaxID=7830 RepID=UPI0018F2E1BF|nr:rhotekin-2-like [Scyliorhinus canicula]
MGSDPKDSDIQGKIDFETRMREGICKLLAASSQRDQVLHVAKNLLTCNARILHYVAELQRHREEHTLPKEAPRLSGTQMKEHSPCSGKVAISDIRIPLMWKDSDHFNNRGRGQRFAVFCLVKIGTQIFDTEMVTVDRTLTDICFENLMIFDDVKPGFELRLEVYSCCMEEGPSIVNTPKRLARKISTSLSRATGKKLTSALESGDLDSILLTNPVAAGVKYHLLAETILKLDDAEASFRTHGLSILGNEESSFWLPLYGNLCCRLIAQPACMTTDMMTGYLNLEQTVGGLANWTRLYCVLRRGYLMVYYTPEEIEAQVDPTLKIAIDKETRIRTMGKGSAMKMYSFSLINPYSGETTSRVFSADCKDDLQQWMEAFWQHFGDMSQWKHCCKELMKIEIMSPRKPPLFLTKQATSVYDDMNVESPRKDESLVDIIRNRIQATDGEFLLGQQEGSHSPRWAALFDGSHDMVIQKSTLTPEGRGQPALTSLGRAKKRPAPPPPAGKQPFQQGDSHPEWDQKENSWNAPCSSGVEPSEAPPQHRSASQVLGGNATQVAAKLGLPDKPVPAPRQKRSIRAKFDPRTWIPSQV